MTNTSFLKTTTFSILFASFLLLNFNFPARKLPVKKLDLGDCFFLFGSENEVIKDEKAYQAALARNLNNNTEDCKNKVFPKIDFEKYTLLSYYKEGGGCKINFYPKVRKNWFKKKYVFTVKVEGSGNCEMLGFSYNWILVPKLPKGYTVEFK